MLLFTPDYDENEECHHLSTEHLILIGIIIGITALIFCASLICVVCICKSYRKGKEGLKRRAFDSADKTMELYTELLKSLYVKVERTTDNEMDKLFEKIEQYSSVLEDLARVHICVITEDGSPQEGVISPDCSSSDNGSSQNGVNIFILIAFRYAYMYTGVDASMYTHICV